MKRKTLLVTLALGLTLGALLAPADHRELQRELAAVETEAERLAVDLEAHAASVTLVREYQSKKAELERRIALVQEFRSRSLRPEALGREIERWRREGQAVAWFDLDSHRLRVALGDSEVEVAQAIRRAQNLRALGLLGSFELRWIRPEGAEPVRQLEIVADRADLTDAAPGGAP